MSINTRTEYRAFDVNHNVCGRGETAQEALADMAATLGEVLFGSDEPDGVHWYVLAFEQEQDKDSYEWVDLDEGELVSKS